MSVTLHRVFRSERGDRDLFVFVDDSRLDFVRDHLLPVRESTSVAHESVGIGACLDVDPISLHNVIGHRLQSRGTIHFERDLPARCPPAENQIGIAGRVIGMEVSHECHLQIAGFGRRDSPEGSSLGAANDARSEIDKVSAIINSDNGGRARTIRVGHRSARAEEYDPRPYRAPRRCPTRESSESTNR